MARKFELNKGRKLSGKFAPFPNHVLTSEEYARLSSHAVKLLLDLLGQFNGYNNGDFAAAWSMMSQRGWKSRDTLTRALRELIESGWIIKTRQGGKNVCSLYGVTWIQIDACDGKLDLQPPHGVLNTWRTKPLTRRSGQANTATVSIEAKSDEPTH